MPLLCVNIDHVATLRQARLGREPEPATAAALAEQGGAAGLIMHLREDRRHIQDRDIEIVSRTCNTKWNLEMAATQEMQAMALKYKPYSVCLVPEKRQELTTEGGLDVASRVDELRDYLRPIHEAGIASSLFIDAHPAQIDAAQAIGSEYIELHTGHYADAPLGPKREALLKEILAGVTHAQGLGLKVNLGHGLDYVNIQPFAHVPGICEYSIGHSIMSRAIFTGLPQAVRDMVEIIRTFVD